MKEFNLPPGTLKKISDEFQIAIGSKESQSFLSISKDRITQSSIEEEDSHFDTFYDKASGAVYVSQPAIPLPFKVVETDDTIDIYLYPCSEEYPLPNKRGPINLARNLRFFIMEILQDKLHFTTDPEPHPLIK